MLESLEELRVFVQIVESGSMAAAARALGMPPNTVSRRLAALEERLGAPLLYRTTRSLSVSDVGRAFVGRARRILDEAQAAEAMVRDAHEGLSGMVRVAVPSLLSQDLLGPLGALLHQHPGLRVQLFIRDHPVNPIAEGLDLVVLGGYLQDSTLVTRKLTDVHPMLVATRAYLDRHGTPNTPQDLAHHAHVLFHRDPPQSSWTLRGPDGEDQVVSIESRFEASDGRTLMDALRAGLGIGLTSPRLLRTMPELVRVLPEYSLGSIPVYAVYPAAGPRSERLSAVLQAFQDALHPERDGENA